MFHQVTPLLKIYCEKGTGQKKKKRHWAEPLRHVRGIFLINIAHNLKTEKNRRHQTNRRLAT